MRFVTAALRGGAITAILLIGGAVAQEPPKPGPEHAILKQDAGTWDATVETRMDPNGEFSTSKGVENNKLICGGLWIVQEFKGEFGGQTFEGHGVAGYDLNKKKYVGSWVDSMSSVMYQTESTYDPEKKVATGSMEGYEGGNLHKMRSTMEYKSDGTRVFSMFAPGPDNKDFLMMKITYKRRPGGANGNAK
jgi:hypothetical protein